MSAAATVFLKSGLTNEEGLTLASLLDRSGYGIDPLSVADRSVQKSSTESSDTSSPRKLSAALNTAGMVLQPCLGPVVTVSDTKQSLTIHARTDIPIIAWAGHYCPRKYDVKAGAACRFRCWVDVCLLKEFGVCVL